MKDRKNRTFTPKNFNGDHTGSNLFGITTILINIIAIAVFIGAYYYIIQHNLFSEYTTYIYWTMNVLVTYNIIAASARSFLAPILAVLAAASAYIGMNYYGIVILSMAEIWQLVILGIVGLLVTIMLRL